MNGEDEEDVSFGEDAEMPDDGDDNPCWEVREGNAYMPRSNRI